LEEVETTCADVAGGWVWVDVVVVIREDVDFEKVEVAVFENIEVVAELAEFENTKGVYEAELV